MAKVSTRTPPLISLYFCQERGDPDYGSCLWAVFNFDLERYELSITSDCGNYAYGWVPTHKSESFMHLMARLDSGYLLDKLASPCVINEEATFEAVKELMEAWGVDFSETDRWGRSRIRHGRNQRLLLSEQRARCPRCLRAKVRGHIYGNL